MFGFLFELKSNVTYAERNGHLYLALNWFCNFLIVSMLKNLSRKLIKVK